MTTKTSALNDWRAASEAAESVGKVLGARWRTARSLADSPYWSKPTSWFNGQASRLFSARVPHSSY